MWLMALSCEFAAHVPGTTYLALRLKVEGTDRPALSKGNKIYLLVTLKLFLGPWHCPGNQQRLQEIIAPSQEKAWHI